MGGDPVRRRLFDYPVYVRAPDRERIQNGRAAPGGPRGSYKKGWELRLVVPIEELDAVRALIVQAGYSLAKPFFKGNQLIQPIYGYRPVSDYLTLTEAGTVEHRVTRPEPRPAEP